MSLTDLPVEVEIYPTSNPYIWVWYGADHILLRSHKFLLQYRINRAVRKLKKRRELRRYIESRYA